MTNESWGKDRPMLLERLILNRWRLVILCLAFAAVGACNEAPSGYVVCVSPGGKETRTTVRNEWLFIDGMWMGYEIKGEVRAFPTETYRPGVGERCKFFRVGS